jgi:hypothetical protein
MLPRKLQMALCKQWSWQVEQSADISLSKTVKVVYLAYQNASATGVKEIFEHC